MVDTEEELKRRIHQAKEKEDGFDRILFGMVKDQPNAPSLNEIMENLDVVIVDLIAEMRREGVK